MEQLSDAQGLEITTDAISSMSIPSANLGGGHGGRGGGNRGYGIPQMSSFSTPNASSLIASRGHRDLLSGNVSYSDLDLSVGANASAIDGSSGLNEPDSPSSPESNFDSSELLSNPLSHQDEVTQRLVQSGPIGIAAAAAITSSSRKRKRLHTFETNPSFRKRHCSKLTKKLKETIDELAARVGLQAVVVTYRPGKGNGKNDPSFKVFGAAPLSGIVKNQRDHIVNEMEAALHQQAPPISTPPSSTPQGEPMFELPTLVFDGIPTPVHKMTQAQLRTFIPNMLKYSTGRGKPGWGKDDVRPPWWPDDIPWANVRSDVRTTEQKKALQWTDALRRIVINCYLHHGRMDLLPEFSLDLLQQYLTPQVAEQLQVSTGTLGIGGEAVVEYR
jgi:nuclear respiratory factor 1